MFSKKWIGLIVPMLVTGLVLTGCGTAAAQSTNSSGSSSTAATGSEINGPISPGEVLVGAAASPPTGAGNGELFLEQIRTQNSVKVSLEKGANALQVAISGNNVYVPTLQGKTYVVNLPSHKVVSTFPTPEGARIADISKTNHLLIITGSNSVTAYSLPSLKKDFQLNVGGNALAIAGNQAYLSSNSLQQTRIINLKSGKITGTVPVGNIEDSVYDPHNHTLWLANWSNGDMTVLNTRDNKVVKVIYNKEGGGFNMMQMLNSPGGFMQLAVGPHGKHVYAASFSGNIMVYNTNQDVFEKNIPTVSNAKLSGIAINPSGTYVYTTVENMHETVAVSLTTDKVVSTYPGLMANRWLVARLS